MNLVYNILKIKAMAIFFKKVQKKNLKDPSGGNLWYPIIKSVGVLKEKEVAKLIADETTLNPKEAEMTIYQLVKILIREMLNGYTIQLGELGNFRLTIHAEGVEKSEDVNPNLIKKINLRFQPTVNVKEALQKAHFSPAEKISE